MFQLEGQQNFVKFAGEGFFGRQIHIARHLHGDGGGPLAFGAAHIGQARANHPQIVHAAVLVKARVFNGQHRVNHHVGNVVDGGQRAALFTKFTQ